MPGILFNSRILIALISGLMRKEESPTFRCSCEFPNFKGSRDDSSLYCFLYISEEISLMRSSSPAGILTLFSKKSQHLEQLWSSYSLISSTTVQANALQDGKDLAFEQA